MPSAGARYDGSTREAAAHFCAWRCSIPPPRAPPFQLIKRFEAGVEMLAAAALASARQQLQRRLQGERVLRSICRGVSLRSARAEAAERKGAMVRLLARESASRSAALCSSPPELMLLVMLRANAQTPNRVLTLRFVSDYIYRSFQIIPSPALPIAAHVNITLSPPYLFVTTTTIRRRPGGELARGRSQEGRRKEGRKTARKKEG